MDTVRKNGIVHKVHKFPDERNWGVTACGLPIGPMEKGEEEEITCPECLEMGAAHKTPER